MSTFLSKIKRFKKILFNRMNLLNFAQLGVVMKQICATLLILFLTLTFVSSINADTLTLSNKNRIDGIILGATPISLVFLPPFSKSPLDISWEEIASLKTANTYNLTIASGEQLTGTISYSSNKGVQINSIFLGLVDVKLNQLRLITPVTEPQTKPHNDSKNIDTPTAQTSNEQIPTKNEKNIPQEPTSTYGSETEDPPVTFLRGSTVLLAPGQMEGRIGFTYSPEKAASGYTFHRQRSFTTNLSLNVGILDNLEAWINVPFAYVDARFDAAIPTIKDGRQSKFALKDISIGGNAVIIQESDEWPEVSMSASITFPTGKEPYDVNNIYYSGNGHWRTTLGLNFLRSTDPAIIYGGISVGYNWPHYQYGAKYKYDPDYGYYFGMGMAVNDRLSFNTRFQGSYQPALSYDGDKEGRISQDPMWAVVGFSYRMSSSLIFEPQVSFGLNDDANGSSFSLGFSKKF